MNFLKLILVTCIITSLFSCSGPLTESNNNQTVEYQLGSPFQIQLEGELWDVFLEINCEYLKNIKIRSTLSVYYTELISLF